MAHPAFPFTHDMVVVHKAFRREFGQASTWVRRVAPGDTAQAALVHQYLQKLFDTLHHHHEAEDVELWPRLRERTTGQEALLDAMEAQHSGIDPALAEARALGERWAAAGDVASRDAFADRLDALRGPLLAHLDQEESDILPLAQQHLTEDEWGLLGAYAIAHTPKSDLLRNIGGLLEDATPEERDLMLHHLPVVAKVLYRAVGRRSYIKMATAVRGVAPEGL
jgi:hemerythrin-like domain-containing protein